MTAKATKTPAEWIEHFEAEANSLYDAAQAIMDTVQKSDSGEFTEEEQAEYDRIMGPPGKETEGAIAQAHAHKKRWMDILEKQETLEQRRLQEARDSALQQGAQNKAQTESLKEHGRSGGGYHTGGACYALGSKIPIVIPRNAMTHRPLPEAMEGPEQAYAAGMFFTAALFNWEPAVNFCKQHGIKITLDQQEIGTPGKGGFLVPSDLERSIIQIREQYGTFRAHSRVYNMMTETKDLPKDMQGIVVTPASERSDMKANNSTSKDWIRPQLVARKWGGYTTWSTELDEDGIIDIGADLTRDYGRAFAKAEDRVGFAGAGGAPDQQITGIRNALLASSVLTLPVNASPSLGDITSDHLDELMGMPPNLEEDSAAWYCHKTVWANTFQKLAKAGGGNTIRDLEMGADIRPGGTGRRPNFVYNSYPGYWINEGMPKKTDVAAALKGIIVFGSLNQGVAFGSRRGVTIRISEHAEFQTDEIALKGTQRFDAIVHETGTATATDPAGTITQIDFGPAS